MQRGRAAAIGALQRRGRALARQHPVEGRRRVAARRAGGGAVERRGAVAVDRLEELRGRRARRGEERARRGAGEASEGRQRRDRAGQVQRAPVVEAARRVGTTAEQHLDAREAGVLGRHLGVHGGGARRRGLVLMQRLRPVQRRGLRP
jgi:hypothetical protein